MVSSLFGESKEPSTGAQYTNTTFQICQLRPLCVCLSSQHYPLIAIVTYTHTPQVQRIRRDFQRDRPTQTQSTRLWWDIARNNWCIPPLPSKTVRCAYLGPLFHLHTIFELSRQSGNHNKVSLFTHDETYRASWVIGSQTGGQEMENISFSHGYPANGVAGWERTTSCCELWKKTDFLTVNCF